MRLASSSAPIMPARSTRRGRRRAVADVCWDQDDKTVYNFAQFAQLTTKKMREVEKEEAAAEGRKLRKPKLRTRPRAEA